MKGSCTFSIIFWGSLKGNGVSKKLHHMKNEEDFERSREILHHFPFVFFHWQGNNYHLVWILFHLSSSLREVIQKNLRRFFWWIELIQYGKKWIQWETLNSEKKTIDHEKCTQVSPFFKNFNWTNDRFFPFFHILCFIQILWDFFLVKTVHSSLA